MRFSCISLTDIGPVKSEAPEQRPRTGAGSGRRRQTAGPDRPVVSGVEPARSRLETIESAARQQPNGRPESGAGAEVAAENGSLLLAPRGGLLRLPGERVGRRAADLRRLEAVRRRAGLLPRLGRKPGEAQVHR